VPNYADSLNYIVNVRCSILSKIIVLLHTPIPRFTAVRDRVQRSI